MKQLLIMVVMFLAIPFSYAETPQIEPLQVTVRTIYPEQINTVEAAIKWLIEPSGYKVLDTYPGAKTILNGSIPNNAQLNRVMPVLDAIQLLIGEDNTIILDKKHHLITFSKGH